MEKQIHVFDLLTIHEEEEEEFYKFFHKYKLDPLFTDEHRTTPITVPRTDMKGIINPETSFHKTLKELGNILTVGDGSQKYQQALFRIIDEATHIRTVISTARKIVDYEKNVVLDKHKFNLWNIVWYNKELK